MKNVLFTFLLFPLLFTACTASTESGNTGAVSAQEYIQNKGSDTMVNLALAWAEAYQQQHPEVQISVTGGGSGTGIAALINGTVDIANASRAIKPEESAEASAQGATPYQVVVARDAIAVIINPENPVRELTLEQISAIYRGEINNWSEVGGEDRPIVRLSRESNSGTHVYFLETVVRLGDSHSTALFAPQTLLLPSSEGIISEVRDNPNAIGYDGLGYVTSEVQVVAVADAGSNTYILPSAQTVNDNLYPISRDLYMYTLGEPQGVIADYLAWILSAAGQQLVNNLGFVPVIGAAQ